MGTKHILNDVAGTVEFTGTKLGHATSEMHKRQARWSEITIYKTDAGTYIVHKVGHSRVFHKPGAQCSKKGVTVKPTLDLIPCRRCVPYHTDALVSVETDRASVSVAERPEGAVENCKTTDGDGAIFFTRIAREALEQAGAADRPLLDAYTHQYIV